MNEPAKKTDKTGDDERSSLAVGYQWSIVISTIGMQMTLPALFGYWLDKRLGTVMLFTLLGAVLGMTSGMMQLLKISKDSEKE